MIQYSVIVPVYNVEQVLERCIESVLNQTLKDFELILIDDGSTDRSGKICDQYEKKDSRIKVIHSENKGVSHARNIGITNAKGKYIVFIDSDDYVENTFLYNFSMPVQDLIVAGYLIERENCKSVIRKSDEKIFCISDKRELCSRLKDGFFNYVWAKRFTTELIKQGNIKFNEKMNLSEDTDFVYRYLKMCRNVYISEHVDYHYIKYNQETLSSIRNTISDIEKIEEINNILEKNLLELIGDDTNRIMEKRMAIFYKDFLLNHILKYADECTLDYIRYLFKQKWFGCFLRNVDEMLKGENIKFRWLLKTKSGFVFWLYLKERKIKKQIDFFFTRCKRQPYKIYNIWFKAVKPIKILDTIETIQAIIKEEKSVCRFGDGELRMINSRHMIGFQAYNEKLSARLFEVLSSTDENIMICIPRTIYEQKHMTEKAACFWEEIFFNRRRDIKNMLNNRKKQIYGDSLFTRIYMDYKDKTKSKELFYHIKQIWKNKEIVIVEGEQSRLGVGNDLFEDAKSVQRILAPAIDAFSCYEKILECCKKYCNNKLVLIALGPTATILAYDLAKIGIQAIDIGHIDVEYEWYNAKVSKKSIINGKFVNEIAEGRNVSNVTDEKYLREIISIVKNN